MHYRDLDGSNNAAEGLRTMREEQFTIRHGDRLGIPNAGTYQFSFRFWSSCVKILQGDAAILQAYRGQAFIVV